MLVARPGPSGRAARAPATEPSQLQVKLQLSVTEGTLGSNSRNDQARCGATEEAQWAESWLSVWGPEFNPRFWDTATNHPGGHCSVWCLSKTSPTGSGPQKVHCWETARAVEVGSEGSGAQGSLPLICS